MPFQVRKNNFTEHRIVPSPIDPQHPNLNTGELLVQIEAFAYTANNITYAVLGDRMQYWNFFPAEAEAADWGLIPVWGFAEVVASEAKAIPVRERLFGYFPPAKYLKMQADHVSTRRFIDVTEHRQALPAGYNVYQRVQADANYNRQMDRERMLLFPLLLTSFCLWDLLQAKDWYGAEQLIILSASSKTSIGLAYGHAAQKQGPKVIGLSSAHNLATLEALGLYDQCLSYEALAEIDPQRASVIVDMSGNSTVLAQLNERLGDQRKYTLNVGLTHWQEGASLSKLSKERSEVFFAPAQAQARIQEWGAAKFHQTTTDFMIGAVVRLKSWLQLKEVEGLTGLQAVHPLVCEGKVPPNEGLIIRL